MVPTRSQRCAGQRQALRGCRHYPRMTEPTESSPRKLRLALHTAPAPFRGHNGQDYRVHLEEWLREYEKWYRDIREPTLNFTRQTQHSPKKKAPLTQQEK